MPQFEWVPACLAVVALWALVSGIDDLFLQLALAWRYASGRQEFEWPSAGELRRAPRPRMAVFIPLWQEHRVIERMLRHNLKVTRAARCDFFVGVYPNDPGTRAAVDRMARRHSRVRAAMNPQPGPTSKADCLNAIYECMLAEEQRSGSRYDVVVIHDAEDLIDPEAPRLTGWFCARYGMVQVPVLPLPTPAREWTHGLYCDEFAEYQIKDIPVRQMLGGFIASNGVGTGFAREVLDQLAAASGGRIFEPASLAEDYQVGLRIHQLGWPQVFLNLRPGPLGPVATREYFPRGFGAAVRQRTRWVMGITLQSWQRFGWRVAPRQLYWLWRDRKGLAGNLLTPVVNLAFLYGAAVWIHTGRLPRAPEPGLEWVYGATVAISLLQMAVRGACSAHLYGWRFALGVPVRAVWGNGLNCAATVLALWRFFSARLQGQPLSWAKTEHVYPSEAALAPYTPAAAEEFRSR
ncbi:MAG: glycosyl transferase family protein [Bryobacteraceae bacterium]